MKITMYGAEICSDCVEAKAKLDTYPNIELNYKDITKSTQLLKEFLSYRDHDEMFAQVVKDGRIGIPFFMLEDGTKTFSIYEHLDIEKPIKVANSCSLDGNC
jgi:glutaredoxin-related protein